MATPDLSQLKHALVNAPLHFYTEVKDDGTEILRHIRVQMKVYEVPADGITIDTLPANSVDSKAIKDETVELRDLSPEAREAMENKFADDGDVRSALGLPAASSD